MSHSQPISEFWDALGIERLDLIQANISLGGYVSSDDRLRTFDEEIAGIERIRSLLRRHRNTLLPVHRLPTEILAYIFWYTAEEDEDKEYSIQELPMVPAHTSLPWSKLEAVRLPDVQSIIKITHVCSQWRSIALAHGNLWSNLDLETISIHSIPEILARSQNHALSASIREDKSQGSLSHCGILDP
ncbi:hypothetical protein DENSPDRAFT_841327 [Dentipellis sp. KUC8613]|nr:hypothetical protein DENSPDRAFT_841327 [Dentipellis sp. KUC8613]